MVLKCKRCKRPLKNDNGTGYGPTCWHKHKQEIKQYKNLLNDYELINNE